MTTARRACLGTELGVLAAWLAFPAMASFYPWPGRSAEWGLMLVLWLYTLPFLAILAAPGAFILACIHAAKMEAWAPRAGSVAHIRRVGVLLGLPLGVANLALVYAALSALSPRGIPLAPEMAPWLIPAVAGGAGLGWGVTIGLTPGRAALARKAARPRLPRKPRRDGPPFFDNRATRNFRRTA